MYYRISLIPIEYLLSDLAVSLTLAEYAVRLLSD